MEEKEYIITVDDPAVWDEIWDLITVDGLGDNYIPTRAVGVANDRPFNDYSAHFHFTDAEAAELMKDSRIQSIELRADLQEDVIKEHFGVRPGHYDKSEATTANMKN